MAPILNFITHATARRLCEVFRHSAGNLNDPYREEFGLVKKIMAVPAQLRATVLWTEVNENWP